MQLTYGVLLAALVAFGSPALAQRTTTVTSTKIVTSTLPASTSTKVETKFSTVTSRVPTSIRTTIVSVSTKPVTTTRTIEETQTVTKPTTIKTTITKTDTVTTPTTVLKTATTTKKVTETDVETVTKPTTVTRKTTLTETDVETRSTTIKTTILKTSTITAPPSTVTKTTVEPHTTTVTVYDPPTKPGSGSTSNAAAAAWPRDQEAYRCAVATPDDASKAGVLDSENYNSPALDLSCTYADASTKAKVASCEFGADGTLTKGDADLCPAPTKEMNPLKDYDYLGCPLTVGNSTSGPTESHVHINWDPASGDMVDNSLNCVYDAASNYELCNYDILTGDLIGNSGDDCPLSVAAA